MKNKLVISLLAILVIVLSVFSYLLSSKTLESTKSFEREITQVETTSDSDETEDIEKDLNETESEDFEEELLEIETQIN